MSYDEWRQVLKDTLQNREQALIFIERQTYKSLGYSSISASMDTWWLVAFQFPKSLYACKLMIKIKLGVEPLQNNLYHKEGIGATKTCKLCMCNTEDAGHFLFSCHALDLPRTNVCTALSQIYGKDNDVMSSQDVKMVVNPPPDCDINKLADSVYEMLRIRALHLPKI